jgi:hypothetical protein
MFWWFGRAATVPTPVPPPAKSKGDFVFNLIVGGLVFLVGIVKLTAYYQDKVQADEEAAVQRKRQQWESQERQTYAAVAARTSTIQQWQQETAEREAATRRQREWQARQQLETAKFQQKAHSQQQQRLPQTAFSSSGGLRFNADSPPHDPPHDGLSGRWVSRKNFPLEATSFGVYACDCGRTWDSAYSWRDYTQQCKGCEQPSYPLWMWLNDGHRSDPRMVSRDDKPHDQARCGKCTKLRSPCWLLGGRR